MAKILCQKRNCTNPIPVKVIYSAESRGQFAKYCSPECRAAEKTRRAYERQKAKRKLKKAQMQKMQISSRGVFMS